MDTVGEGEWDEWREWQGNMHITVCKQTVGENLLHHSGSSDRSSATTTERHRMGWEVQGRSRGRGRTVPRLIHADARQKATRYCQAILLQLKRYIFFKKDTLSCKSLTSSHQQPSLLPQEVLAILTDCRTGAQASSGSRSSASRPNYRKSQLLLKAV